MRRNRVVAIRFDPLNLGTFGVFVDGDGDGVRQTDVDNGIDVPLDGTGTASIAQYFAAVAVRVATDVPAPDDNGVVAADSDPVRIGNSNFLSLHPIGTSTSGTIYLAGEGGTQVCVRVFGATGRVRVLWFNRGGGVWRQE
jgi:hypothetical protein